MILTLIKTLTAAGDSSLAFVDGTSSVVFDDTYDEYMFVWTNVNPVDNDVSLTFQVNAVGASGYNEYVTSSIFRTYHTEDDGTASVAYAGNEDIAQGTGDIIIGRFIGNEADENGAGILRIFQPAATAFQPHFHARAICNSGTPSAMGNFTTGYINAGSGGGALAIDEISFQMETGNFDGVIQMYGIS